MFSKVIILTIVIHSWLVSCSDVEVKTPLGKIRGIIQQSRKGNDYYSFRGVRYAEPPVGENRFRPSTPVKPWEGAMDATKDGFICPQADVPHSLMSEDCLNLNVYTKTLQEGLLPVMLFVHGGYFATGGSHSNIFWNPRYLMEKDIVLVVINYRIGALGFISTGTAEAPGNQGLKDQVLAMQWVRDNIKYFGGNPKQVTLWGHSSGSMMVTLHMVSPMSRELFHRAIAMSGSAISHVETSVKKTTKNIATVLNCRTDDAELLVECLRIIPYEKFVEIAPRIFDWFYEIEKNFGQEQFLDENPSILLAQGKVARVPMIVGVTKDECEPIAHTFYNFTTITDDLNKDFYKEAPKHFMYDPALTSVTEKFRYYYLRNKPITRKTLPGFAKLYSDAVLGHGVHRFVMFVRKYIEVFYYRQDFQGRYSWVYGSDGSPVGVCHADDLLYAFVHTEKAPVFTERDPENVMVETSTTLFTTFARTGDPNNRTNPWTSNIRWQSSSRNRVKMLYINTESYLGPETYLNRMRLWDKLFPVPLRFFVQIYASLVLFKIAKAQLRGQGIRDAYMDFNLLDAIIIPMDDGVSFVPGADNFPAYRFEADANVKSPYRIILPEKLYEFAVVAIFKTEVRKGGYLFSVVNPLDTVVQLGIHLSPAIKDKWNVTLLYTDASIHSISKKLASFEIDYNKKWTIVAFQVHSNKVRFHHNCMQIKEITVKREPVELFFDSASTLYLAQAGPINKGHFEVSTFHIFLRISQQIVLSKMLRIKIYKFNLYEGELYYLLFLFKKMY